MFPEFPLSFFSGPLAWFRDTLVTDQFFWYFPLFFTIPLRTDESKEGEKWKLLRLTGQVMGCVGSGEETNKKGVWFTHFSKQT